MARRDQARDGCDEPINSVDLYPTLLELAGAKPEPGYVLDGLCYVSLLTGSATRLSREAIYWYFPGYLGAGRDNWRTTPAGAIRQGDHKLLEFFEDGHLELYDLKHDLGEQHNIAAEKPELAKQLHAKLVGWRQSIGAPMPKPRTGQEPATKPDRRGMRRQGAAEG